MSVRLPVAAFAALSLLAGCGQTGQLHQPEDAPAREHYLISGNKKKPKAATPAEAAPEAAPDASTPTSP